MAEEKSSVLVLTLLLGMFLQVLFGFADSRDTPHRTAIAFSKAYFALDPDMAAEMCGGGVTDEEVDVVSEYIANQSIEATRRGFDLGWMKYGLHHIIAETVSSSEDAAQVRITAMRRKAINPLFAWVAGLFRIGESYHVEAELDLVREKNDWKVCGKLYDLQEI